MKFAKQALAADKDAKKMLRSMSPKLPKGPRYNQCQKAVENYKIVTNVVINKLKLKGKVLDTKDVAALTRLAADVLQCDASLVRPLTQEFLNVLMDAGTIDLLAWQIAGNKKIVLTRPAVLFNNRQTEKCWMAGVIINVVKCPLHDDKYIKIKLINGPGAGFIVYAKISPNSLRSFSCVTGALKKGSDKKTRGMSSVRQCVLFKVMVYTNGQASAYALEENPTFKRIIKSTNTQMISWVKATPSQKKHNKELFHKRLSPCVYGYNVACHACEFGYDGKNACVRACRPKQIVKKEAVPLSITLKGKNLCPKNLEEV